VTRAALAYLVDGRDLAVGFLDLANCMRVAMAVDTRGLAIMNTAADRSHCPAMAVAAAVFVGQRFHATLVALVNNVRMAFAAGDIRVRRRRVLDIVMTSEAILEGLGVSERCDKQKPETEKQFRARDPGRGHIHSPESLCEWF
jgi:hypothetical protein